MIVKTKIAAVVVVMTSSLLADNKRGEHLNCILPSLEPGGHTIVWVFFADKGRYEITRPTIPTNIVSQRSLFRRQKVRATDELIDYTDLPIEQTYIDALLDIGVHVRHRSRWFNGVSVAATRMQIEQIARLSFVREIEVVWRARRENETASHIPSGSELEATHPNNKNALLDLNYGPSLTQVQSVNVPAVHNTGNYGQGVVVGVFDNGFRLLNHEAFDTLRPRIVATYDFVDHKVSVVPNNTQSNFGAHGIVTLSTLGGYKPGELIGPAFGASFILARTENDSSETPIEEDNWLAAIEWADSIGVDVTSTSLGYLDYDPPYTSWTWQNMNGNATLITRAADMAVGKGIVVLNSAGNNGFDPSHNTLNAPADGDSVITVGATAPGGTRAGFSSVGPTTSTPPRIKPDVMAMGTAVHCASPTDPIGYTYQQGTSLSCPLAAGVAALMLHAKPNATPMQILNAMRMTASQANAPDNLMGWGVINAAAAINYLAGVAQPPGTFILGDSYPNPFPTPANPSATIGVNLSEQSEVTLTIYNTLGQDVRTVVHEQRPLGISYTSWDGRNSSGINVASGVYFYRLDAKGISGRVFTETKRLIVLR